MNPVPMQCPLCGGTIQIDPTHAGQQVGCPLCQGVLLLPPPEFFGMPGGYQEPPAHLPPPSAPQLGCPVCGGGFQVLPEMAGHQVACPHCQSAVTIPDLWSGGVAGAAYPPPPPSYEMPPPSMQFIGLPGMGQEVRAGYSQPSQQTSAYAPPPFEQPVPPDVMAGVPMGVAVATPPLPAPPLQRPADFPSAPATELAAPPTPPPRDDRFPPQRTRETSSPASEQRRGDAHLYPPGMQPKERDAQQDSEKAHRPKDDRFPPKARKPEREESRPEPKLETKQPPLVEPIPASPAAADALLSPTVPGVLSPAIDALLPPGAASETVPAPLRPVDGLLPPGAAAAGTAALDEGVGVSRHSVVDTLLPPGATPEPNAIPTEQVALPDAPPPAPKPMPTATAGQLVLPTPDGDYVTVEKKEGVKTISSKGEEIEIRKLSPEERTRRRRVKNIIMFTFAVVLLVVVIVIMTRK